MRTCHRWHASVLEEPEVWPMAELDFPEPQQDIWYDSDSGEAEEEDYCTCPE